MAGLYLHIPFCRQACHYCNFHFSTSLKLKEEVLRAIRAELYLRRDFFEKGAILQSIYLGGGTPSLLTGYELEALFETIYQYFRVAPDAEITLEANPDDLDEPYLTQLRQTPVNRLSLGIQSFSDEDLRWMNRAHDAAEARRCIEQVQAAGYHNLTCDLIYGAPTTSDAQWEANVRILLEYGVPHLSCYCLTVEPKTALAHFVKTGQSPPVDDDKAVRQFLHLMEAMETAGYEHYEISNFALSGHYAKHNTAYWLGAPYLGVGPGAHSFTGQIRQWNLPNNPRYAKLVQANAPWQSLKGLVWEEETLTPADCYNEYVMTGLRTKWGCNLLQISAMGDFFAAHFTKQVETFVVQGLVRRQDYHYALTREGKLLADFISAELFYTAVAGN